MLRKLLLAVATFIAMMGFAFAQVDVNKADQAALDSVKGIGPKMSKSIIDERKKNGDFKDWPDLQKRVKGIGDKSSDNLSKSGLTVNGQSKPNAPAAKADTKADTKADAKAKSDSKESAKSKDMSATSASGNAGSTASKSDGTKSSDSKAAKSSNSSTSTTGSTTGSSTGASSGNSAPAAAAGAKK